MKRNEWSILFCTKCYEPTPPVSGMMTDHLGFVCDDCLNNELGKEDFDEFEGVVEDAARAPE